MKKDIPEIDDLLDGINDPDIMLRPKTPDKEEVNDIQEEKTPDPPSESINEESTNEDATIHLPILENRNHQCLRVVWMLGLMSSRPGHVRFY